MCIAFIVLKQRETYSLLPHFITRYQRHINTVIEDILQRHYAEGTSAENLAEEPSPSPWTIRRWIYKFSKMIVSAENRVEKFLIGNIPSYSAATQNSETMLNKLSEIKRKAHLIIKYIKSFDIHLAGAITITFMQTASFYLKAYLLALVFLSCRFRLYKIRIRQILRKVCQFYRYW